MSKQPTIQTVTEGFSAFSQINANFEAIRSQFLQVLSRDGSTPNEMAADLNLDGNDVMNVGTLDAQRIVLRGVDIEALIGSPDALADILADYVTLAVYTAGIASLQAQIDSLPDDLAGDFLPIAGGTLTGALGVNGAVNLGSTLSVVGQTNLARLIASTRVETPIVWESSVDLGSASLYQLNLNNGSHFRLDLDQDAVVSVTNPPNTNKFVCFSILVTNQGSNTITWPVNFLFANGSAPDAPGIGETDIHVFFTFNGGTTYIHAAGPQNISVS